MSTYFELNPSTGDIRVRIPLYNDNADTTPYIFTVVATDGGGRTSSQNAQVTINVRRNLFPPVFSNTPYTTTIPFTISSGFSVFDVNATDRDTVVCLIEFLILNNYIASFIFRSFVLKKRSSYCDG